MLLAQSPYFPTEVEIASLLYTDFHMCVDLSLDSFLSLPMLMHACMLSRFSHVRLCNPMDCSTPGSSVHGIFQVGILEWVAISYSRGSS